MENYIFPSRNINKKDKVVIYGAGNVGEAYVRQILEYNLCQLLCVVDKKAAILTSSYTKIELPIILSKYSFDYVVIAVKSPQKAEEIQKELQDKYAVPNDKIIWHMQKSTWDVYSCVIARKPPMLPDVTKITIGVWMVGGMGDAIIAKKIITELIAKTGYNCHLDIYAEEHIGSFMKSLYQDVPCIKNVYSYREHKPMIDICSYDLIVRPAYVFAIMHRDNDSLRKKNPLFAKLMENLALYLSNEGLLWNHPIDNSVQFYRAKLRGENAFTMYSFGGLFSIKDSRVSLPLVASKEREYKKICQEDSLVYSFITMNYGGNMNSDNNFSKIWPLDYFGRLAAMIKNKYPNLIIVQLGRKDSPKIDNIDLYFAGLDIEIVKYVLRDSLLHIDSESGLVHIASQLDTGCLVAFGPTPIHFFGYPHNINVRVGNCHDCCYLENDFTKCTRRLKRAECMYALTPEIMFDKFMEYFATIYTDKGCVKR